MDFEEEVKAPHPAGGTRGAGTLWPGVSLLWSSQGRVLPDARLPTAEVPADCRTVRSGGVVLDSTLAVPPLRETVHRLPTLSPLPRKRFVQPPGAGEGGASIWEPSTSYRKTVKDKGMPIMYDDRQPAKERQPQGLAPSTVWAVVVVAGRDAWHAAGRLGADSPEGAQLDAAPPAVGRAAAEVPLPSAARDAGRGHAGPGRRILCGPGDSYRNRRSSGVRQRILREAAAGKPFRAIARGLDAAGVSSRAGRALVTPDCRGDRSPSKAEAVNEVVRVGGCRAAGQKRPPEWCQTGRFRDRGYLPPAPCSPPFLLAVGRVRANVRPIRRGTTPD